MEYRYWAFMEDHPAHVTLPQNARADAMDILTWCWTDRLLPSQSGVSPPFDQAECQELNNILRSFGNDANGESGIQAVLHTRLVSRVLMRVARWRQINFRPNKPLPQDISNKRRFNRARPSGFQRTILDVVVMIVFLGVPSLFVSRSNHALLHRVDEESGLFSPRSAGPILLLGGCACLVAAIVLSASVTFLSLPGLDNIGRIPGLVAVVFATFSMVFSVIALFRYKADMECISSNIGPWPGFSGEGLMLHSRRILILSLPLTLLAYSVISFIVGIVLYSFFGVSEAPNVLQKHFEEYTRWTVVGVVGGLAGILFTTVLFMRR
ncbi:hypothetical protein EV361DRAFT_805249 [Lentinula raphanica]|uniref:Uncharacterized protein n=1 Tax=Lentinula raphanica TaxID=153919 RepID=A0AA38P3D5_9AGAR|nr:hypothetical protein EV360DRAFT_31315 [Lentinula raphanica]KAJ3774724.1 hypothetical protein FB446DRAFT_728052 [Lentinula raphanica]KAJ3823232.1 hypothetical protein F5880DRAFT_1482621 [Lentinula raphanica]KAJ3835565.1 hypothetical protein F5878DRAFT_542929 [Lentinula raphanica]KAJ3968656.1 hypothetical protein EV361DRAFT_805249 [Lentinula raphanica]